MLYAVGFLGSLLGRLLRRDTPVTLTSVRLLRFTSPLNHDKAIRELGWEPRPTAEAVRRAARFFTSVADARAGHSRR